MVVEKGRRSFGQRGQKGLFRLPDGIERLMVLDRRRFEFSRRRDQRQPTDLPFESGHRRFEIEIRLEEVEEAKLVNMRTEAILTAETTVVSGDRRSTGGTYTMLGIVNERFDA